MIVALAVRIIVDESRRGSHRSRITEAVVEPPVLLVREHQIIRIEIVHASDANFFYANTFVFVDNIVEHLDFIGGLWITEVGTVASPHNNATTRIVEHQIVGDG